MDKNLSILVKFAALDKLTAPLRRMAGGAREAGKDVAGTRKEILALQKTTGKIGALKDLRADAARTAEQLGYARSRVTALRAEIEETGTPTKRLSSQLLVAERDVARFEKTTGTQSERLEALSQHLREAGVDVGRLADEEGRLGREIEEANGRLGEQRDLKARTAAAEASRSKIADMGERLQGGGVKLVAAGAAIGAPLVLGTKAAIGFETAMAGVAKMVDGTDAQLKVLEGGILDLSRHVPISPPAIASIVEAGGAAGLARAELLEFAESAARMGVAFEMAPEAAGDTMAKWRTAFRMTGPEVDSLADKVNYLSDKTAAGASDISDIITRVGPLAGVAGMAAGETAALGATLTSMGVQSEIAATGIKNTLLALTKGDAATKAQRESFSKLGLEATAVSKSMQRDAAGTITDVLGRISRLKKHQQTAILSELFGSESVGAIAPMLSQLETLEKNLELVGDGGGYAGSMQAEFARQSATTANKLQLASNRVEVMKIRLGDRLLPDLVAGADKFGALADRVSAFAERNPAATKAVVVFLAALAVGLTTIGTLAVAIGTALGPLSFLVGALKTPAASATLLQRALQLLFAPFRMIGSVVGRLTGFVGRLVPWMARLRGSMQYWGVFRTLFGPIGTAIRSLLPLLGPIGAAIAAIGAPVWAIVAAFAALAAIVVGAGVFIYNNWRGIAAFFVSMWTSFATATAPLRASLGALGSALGALGAAFLGWVGRLLGPVIAGIASFGGAVVRFFAPAFRWIGALVGPIALKSWTSFGNIVGSVIGGIVNHLKGLVDGITSGVGWLTRLFNKGKEAPTAKVSAAATSAPKAPPIAGKRAVGGPVMGGRLYLVGERGPELFEAPANGRIIPNQRLGRGLALAGSAALAALPAAAAPPIRAMAASPIRAFAPPTIAAATPLRVQQRTLETTAAASAPRAGGVTGSTVRSVQFTGPITIAVTGAPGQDVNELADIIMARFDDAARRSVASTMADREFDE